MKKFCKALFAAAGIMVIVGAITILAAIIIYNRSGSIVGDVTYTFVGAGGDDIRSLNVFTAYGKTVYRQGSEWSVTFNDVYSKGAFCGVNDHTLYVKTEGPGEIELFGWKIGLFFDFNKNRRAETIITYPAGVELDSVFSEAGIGRIDADKLRAKTVLIQAPFCGIKLKGAMISDRFVIDTLVGNVKSSYGDIAKMTADMRIGKLATPNSTPAEVEYKSKLILK